MVIESAGILSFVLTIVIVGLVFWLLLWLIDFVGLPEPFNKVAKVVLAVVGVLILVNFLLGLTGAPFIKLR